MLGRRMGRVGSIDSVLCLVACTCALALAACSSDAVRTDGSTPDPMVDGSPGGGADGGPRPDGAPMVSDGGGEADAPSSTECASTSAAAAANAGCNGGFSAAPAANAPGGTCTPGGDSMPEGTCTDEMNTCFGNLAGTGGYCVAHCTAPAMQVDAAECPTGFRCFTMGTGDDRFGLCFRDCDATHPCHEGWECEASLGRCEEMEPT
jgi:hypothetical protein